MPAVRVQLVPRVQKGILCKVVRKIEITRELAQEIPHLGLVAPDKLTECSGVLLRHHTCDKFMIVDPGNSRIFVYAN